MNNNDIQILKKIQNGTIDEEVNEFIINSLKWYKNHSKELLKEVDIL